MSYDDVSTGYDQAWTNHMRDQTDRLIQSLPDRPAAGRILDLTCGTGYATRLLSEKYRTRCVGVDFSEGMLQQARRGYSKHCEFVQSDVLLFLRSEAAASAHLITCCWGLGYSHPRTVLREVARVLKPGGFAAIIDNSIFSLFEVAITSALAFMWNPDQLKNLMKFRFLLGRLHCWALFREQRLGVISSWSGRRSYSVHSGNEAIRALRASGAAAGFEFAAEPEHRSEVFSRFAGLLDKRNRGRIRITHRYYAAIGIKE